MAETIRRDPTKPVMDVTEQTFQRDVVQRSFDVPVVIDFWAPWCQPCRVLGPTLEKLAAEGGGDWVLAKVNVDENPRLAQAFGVQGIPAVKAVSGGKLVEEFTGALPESQVRSWLKSFVVSEAPQQGNILEETEQLEPAEAAARLRVALADQPDNDDLKFALGRLLLRERNPEAQALLNEITAASALFNRAQSILGAKDFFFSDLDAAPASATEARYFEAARDMQQDKYEQALDTLIDLVVRDRGLRDDGARKAVIGVLALLGDEHELTPIYRRRLANALF